MSKIETALSKARGQVVRLDPVSGAKAAGKEMVPAQQRSLSDRQARQAAADLRRMDEPWLSEPRTLAEQRIIHLGMSDTQAAMAFSDMRTKILQIAQENCNIVVTSAAKGRDSALIAANLAVSFSLDDSKTAILLDCDLVARSIDQVIPSTSDYGIADYLRNDGVQLEQIICPTGLRRFRVIPAGKSHDHVAEYFTLAKMRELLNELRARYVDRYIVLNAPPIVESADARVLVELADYVVLVVPYGSVTGPQITDAAKLIGDKKLLGVVFSDMPCLPTGHRGVLGWLARLVGYGHEFGRESRKKG
jgi:protein-tyrosine kinase